MTMDKLGETTRMLLVSSSKGGSGSITTRMNIPKKWLDDMELDYQNKEKLEVMYNEDLKVITMRKVN